MKIRNALPNDIESICEILSQLSPIGDIKGSIRSFDYHILPCPNYHLFVAELDNVIVGTTMLHLQHKLSYSGGTAAHIEDVVVDEAYRGRGIGKALVKHAIVVAKEHGCYKIILTCYEKNIPYYESLGFKKHDIGMRMDLS